MVRRMPRARRRPRFGSILSLILSLPLLADCSGTPMPGAKLPPADRIVLAQNQPYQPAPPPRNMAPPPPPSRPPSPAIKDFGHWQWEGQTYRWKPGRDTGSPNRQPTWVPGYWTTDANANRVWVPGYWR